MPRGLYCLILTYKPESSETHSSVDITKAITSSLDDTTTGFKKTLKNIKLSSGTTYGELEMPEAAPLIFPALDRIADIEGSENSQKSNKFKDSGKFVTDYFDRRAQAKYVSSPLSSLYPSLQLLQGVFRSTTDSKLMKIGNAKSNQLSRNA